MHTWHWLNWEGLPYLTCSLLKPWAHGFFTMQFSPRLPSELVTVLQPQAEVYRVKQVHGNIVLTPAEIEQALKAVDNNSLPEADGLITDRTQQSVWVATADCTPVLIGDCQTGQVSAVHAGWRGTAAKIVPNAIARMLTQGSKLPDLRIALGPAIAGEVYQVSTHVAAVVGASVTPSNPSMLHTLQIIPNPPILPDPQPDRVRLDVRRVIELQLENLGIEPEQVAIAPHCTYQEPESFFSYRRNKLKKVQWSGIISNTG